MTMKFTILGCGSSMGVPRPAPGRSLAELSPVIAAEWHPTLNGDLTPLDVSNARNARAWWHCSICGSDWEARINERTRRQNVGCPTCGRGRTAAARMRPESGRSLADLYPDIAVQWHPGRNAPLGRVAKGIGEVGAQV